MQAPPQPVQPKSSLLRISLCGLLLLFLACTPELYPADGLLCDNDSECWGATKCVNGLCQGSTTSFETPSKTDGGSEQGAEPPPERTTPPEETTVPEEVSPEQNTTETPPKDECNCKKDEQCVGGTCIKPQACGDKKCDGKKGENCESCAKDCGCKTDQVCKDKKCQKDPCGDKKCDEKAGENCVTCAKDCACKDGKQCDPGLKVCVTPASCSEKKPCPSGQKCEKGKCVRLCPPASTESWSCNKGKTARIRCGPSNNFKNEEEKCPSGCFQTAGQEAVCCSCPFGGKQCKGATLQQCNPDCSAWEDKEQCKGTDNRICDTSKKSCTCKKGCARGTICTPGKTDELSICKENKYGCLVSSTQKCPANTTCTDGKCCACRPGATKCSGSKVIVCKSDCSGWNAPQDCPRNSQCKNDKCGNCTCVPKTTRCAAGGKIEVCKDTCDGWQVQTTCKADERCNNGSCTKCACNAGTKRCKGNAIEACKSDCSGWETPQACQSSEYCSSGTCIVCACNKGQKRCDGSNAQECKADCSGWQTQSVCNRSQYCSAGACKNCACSPGQKRCSGNTPQICKTDCTGWSNQAACTTSQCLNGSCCLCSPGTYRCDGNGNSQQCDSSCMKWNTASQCSKALGCKGGKCCTCNADTCQSGLLVACDQSTCQTKSPTQCPSGQTCPTGKNQCESTGCTNGATRCSTDGSSLEVCTNNTWQSKPCGTDRKCDPTAKQCLCTCKKTDKKCYTTTKPHYVLACAAGGISSDASCWRREKRCGPKGCRNGKCR